ncbi:DUF4345 family protein [Agromyces albus]|uniref:DUF4345 family protein n=1 Tax=Agromyces albus TaxID=205332 RepID=UPI00278332BE|nr:hypothetical protein [Agromyces albus]MDQ0577483.1 uncharacterized membrane protein YhaH (DUF805 family) [Agromyces albus]
MTLSLRIGLAVLALMELVLGVWTSLFPENFYRDVPTVNLTPPYSEHLFRDFGGATLGLAIVLGAAAIWPTTRLVVIALLAYLAFSAPHLVFHLGHLHDATAIEASLLTVALTATVILPLALIAVATIRARRARDGLSAPRATPEPQ